VVLLNAYALAAAEEHAAGHGVGTAPTLGSAGVLPAVAILMARQGRVPRELLREGLLAAAVVGFLVKTGASISGAEVGCQGEVGTASAMAAAFLAHVNGYPVSVLENAAEIALEHIWG
jgi:L-serine dehydratase